MAGAYAQLIEQLSALERELAEIDMLIEQVTTEAERHEARRRQFTARVQALESDRTASARDVAEPHSQLVTLTKRAALMQAQQEVLQGKRKALLRFQSFLEALAPRVREVEGTDGTGTGGAHVGRGALSAQEEMRREIARQMHDGPAQSIANIALQANIVQRLIESDPKRAQLEVEQLVRVVERALDATKSFIFDVRPMVLDDLGLVPTLRRAALERGQRSGIPVHFESVGVDRRLTPELESALFRIADEAVAGLIDSRADEVALRIGWTVEEIRLTVRVGASQRTGAEEQRIVSEPGQAREAAARAALTRASGEAARERSGAVAERETGPGVPEDVAAELRAWGAALGIEVTISPDRRTVESVARTVV